MLVSRDDTTEQQRTSLQLLEGHTTIINEQMLFLCGVAARMISLDSISTEGCGTLGKKVQPPGYVARSALKAKSRSSSIFSHRELMAPVLPLLPTVQFQGTCNVFVIAVLWFNVLQPHTCYRKNETPSVNQLNKCTTVFLEVQLYPISALIFPF